MIVAALLVLSIGAGAVSAQTWDIRKMDIPPGRRQSPDFGDGPGLAFPENNKPTFAPPDAYSYTYPQDGGPEFGRFSVGKDGRVCIDFGDGRGRCNLYVQRNEMRMILTERGARFPLRIELGLKP